MEGLPWTVFDEKRSPTYLFLNVSLPGVEVIDNDRKHIFIFFLMQEAVVHDDECTRKMTFASILVIRLDGIRVSLFDEIKSKGTVNRD